MIYQLKVTIRHISPPIWRRLLIPADMTLRHLHDVIQRAFGWFDGHLHEFRVGNRRWGTPDPSDDFAGMPPMVNERSALISDLLGAAKSKAVYIYDFGDSWEHEIVVEKILPPDPDVKYPICTAGKRRGPPEDCGGVPGYYNLLDALADPDHEDHEDMSEWIGDEFDPEEFSIDAVNADLAGLWRGRKSKKTPG